MVAIVSDPKRTAKAIRSNLAEAEAVCKRVGEAVRKALFVNRPGDKTGAFHVDAVLRELGCRAECPIHPSSTFVTAGLFGQNGQPLQEHFWNVIVLKTAFYLDIAPDAVLENPPGEILWLVPAEAQKLGYWAGRQGRYFYDEKKIDIELVKQIVQEEEARKAEQ